MAFEEKILGQARPANTSAASIYAPSSVTALVKNIMVCNTTSSPVDFSIYLDNDGTTYDQSTALFYSVEIAGNTTVSLSALLVLTGGNLAVQSSTASALTFSVFGAEVS